jgi:hypothetical protein
MQSPLNMDVLAAEIGGLIVKRQPNDRLQWYEDGQVRVLIEKVLPSRSAVKQTLAGWRKRLRAALKEHLEPNGWKNVGVTPVGAWMFSAPCPLAPTTPS